MKPRRRWLYVEEIDEVTIVGFVNQKIVHEEDIQKIGEQLFAMVDQNKRKILLDFGNVEYLSSAVHGKLITLQRKMDNVGGRLILANIDPAVYEVFEITRLDKFFTIYKNPTDALQAF